jgi:hypothetical protein
MATEQSLSDLARQMWEAREAVERARDRARQTSAPDDQERLRAAEDHLRLYSRKLLPEAADLSGLPTITFFGGLRVSFHVEIKVFLDSMGGPERDQAIRYLQELGFPDVAADLGLRHGKASGARAHEARVLTKFAEAQLAAKADVRWSRIGVSVKRIAKIDRIAGDG